MRNEIKWMNAVRVRAGETWVLAVLPYQAKVCAPCGMRRQKQLDLDEVRDFGSVAAIEILGNWRWVAILRTPQTECGRLRFGDSLLLSDLENMIKTPVIRGNLNSKFTWWQKVEL